MAGSEKAAEQPEETNCSFCQKSRLDVSKLIAGPGVFICDECVGLCVEILAEAERGKPTDTAAVPNWEDRLSDDDLLATLPGSRWLTALQPQGSHR